VRTLIVPLSKNPKPSARIGAREWQDWYVSLAKAVTLLQATPDSRILVLTALWWRDRNGERHTEAGIYQDALAELGVDPSRIIVVEEEYETIGQIAAAKRIAEGRGERLAVVSTFWHAARVRRLLAGSGATLTVGPWWGIPHPREIMMDATVASFLYSFFPGFARRENETRRHALIEKRKRGQLFL
jgi:hypothetical protein